MIYLALVNIFVAGACGNSALDALVRGNTADVVMFSAIGIANVTAGGLLMRVSAGAS